MIKKNALIVLGALCAAGCAEVSRQDVDAVRSEIGVLRSELEARIAQSAAQLDQKINATDAKYANMLALEQTVKSGVARIDHNARLLEASGKSVLQILQVQRNVLKEQLKSVDDQIDALGTGTK